MRQARKYMLQCITGVLLTFLHTLSFCSVDKSTNVVNPSAFQSLHLQARSALQCVAVYCSVLRCVAYMHMHTYTHTSSSVCVCVYMCACSSAFLRACKHAYTCERVRVCLYVCVVMYTRVHLCVCIYMRICVSVCVCVCTSV